MAAVRPTLVYEQHSFDGLTPRQLHDILRLRTDVFVVEQRCPYPEVDGNDPRAQHLLGRDGGELAAYCRWFEDGDRIVLGRIVVAAPRRGRGLGAEIVREALRRIGNRPILIHAQTRMLPFYESLGFRGAGEPYDDYGVLHLRMLRAQDAG